MPLCDSGFIASHALNKHTGTGRLSHRRVTKDLSAQHRKGECSFQFRCTKFKMTSLKSTQQSPFPKGILREKILDMTDCVHKKKMCSVKYFKRLKLVID